MASPKDFEVTPAAKSNWPITMRILKVIIANLLPHLSAKKPPNTESTIFGNAYNEKNILYCVVDKLIDF